MSSEGEDHKTRKPCIAPGFTFLVITLFGITFPAALVLHEAHPAPTASNLTNSDDGEGNHPSMNRVGMGSGCSKDNILVFQGATAPLPNGIPTYTVQIHNVCLYGSCSIRDIHMSCGWFSSARFVNPSVFRRIEYDDCLVNDGEPLSPGDALSFQYANSFKYPISVSSVSC